MNRLVLGKKRALAGPDLQEGLRAGLCAVGIHFGDSRAIPPEAAPLQRFGRATGAPVRSGKDSRGLMPKNRGPERLRARWRASPRGGSCEPWRRRSKRAAAAPFRLLRRRSLEAAAALAVVGGLLLLYAETLDLYRIVTPGGATSNAAGSIQSGRRPALLGAGGDRRRDRRRQRCWPRWTRQRLPAWAAAALAVIALGIVLIGDIPDVTSVRPHDRDRDRRGRTAGRLLGGAGRRRAWRWPGRRPWPGSSRATPAGAEGAPDARRAPRSCRRSTRLR